MKIVSKLFVIQATKNYGFSLVWFYGISTIIGYWMPNLVYIIISNIWFVNTFFTYAQLNDQTVLFLTIQFSICQQSLIISSIAMYH